MKRWLGILLIGLLGACQQQPAAAPSQAQIMPQVWIDAPLAGSALELGEIQVLAHGYHPMGLSTIELSVNGQVVATQQPTMRGSQFGYANLKWQPSQAAAYRLAVRAQSSQGQWSDPASAEVAVGQINSLRIAALPSATSVPSATTTPTTTPTATPTSSPTFTATPTRPIPSNTTRPAPTTVRPSNTPVRSTNTPVLPTPTDTPAPPKPTDTPVPPTATDTPVPSTPTDTPAPILPPIIGEPVASARAFAEQTACGMPDQITISVSVDNFPAGDVSLYYHAGPSRWQSTVMQGGGGNWSRTLFAKREMSGQRFGAFEYYILAQGSDGQSSKSQVYGGIEYLPCNP